MAVVHGVGLSAFLQLEGLIPNHAMDVVLTMTIDRIISLAYTVLVHDVDFQKLTIAISANAKGKPLNIALMDVGLVPDECGDIRLENLDGNMLLSYKVFVRKVDLVKLSRAFAAAARELE